jgi:hypothetical protein
MVVFLERRTSDITIRERFANHSYFRILNTGTVGGISAGLPLRQVKDTLVLENTCVQWACGE